MGLHIFLTTATFAVSKLMWDHYYVHTGFLLAVLCISSWNASNFYFGKRFASRFFEGRASLWSLLPVNLTKFLVDSNAQVWVA